MAFRSDAHRRWWFANRDAGGSVSERQDMKERETSQMVSSITPEIAAQREKSEAANFGEGGGTMTRQEQRIAYAQAMYPHLSGPDALRELNDRGG